MLSLHVAVLALSFVNGGNPVLYDFTATWCGPCRGMEPVVHQLAQQGYPVQKVDIDQNPGLASKYGIQAIPCFVLVADDREVARIQGPASLERLKQMFARLPATGGGGDAGLTTRGQSPAGFAAPQTMPGVDSGDPLTPAGPLTAVPPRGADIDALNAGHDDLIEWLMAASVRLKIDDPNGHSYGSGTIIDAGGGEALILTCGHIFRDSGGQGQIHVDLFGPGAPKGIAGKLIDFDLESDVGLVSIRLDQPVRAIPVAPAGFAVEKGAAVVSVGCNNGSPPTARQSRVTGVNKFLGPPNLQVAGQPVSGRSGGGLFTTEGRVIGVCNAADPTDDEGLYAALASIHAALDKSRLSFLYQPGAGAGHLASTQDSALPDMPATMPRIPAAPASFGEGRGLLRPSTVPHGSGLSNEEEAALSEIRGQSDSAEVICIIRSHGDPTAQSEIIVLDKASPGFLQDLAGERRKQDARMLTSMTTPKSSSGAERTNSSNPRPSPGERVSNPTRQADVPARSRSTWKPHWRQP